MSHSRRAVPTALIALSLLVSYLVAAVAVAGPAAAAGTLTVTVSGKGDVTSDTGGISCSETGGTCSHAYSNTKECDDSVPPICVFVPQDVTLTAGPDRSGYTFQGFTVDGTDCPLTGRSCTITMSGARDVTAVFVDSSPPSVGGVGPSGFKRSPVTLSAAASDNAGVARVDFLVNGVAVGSDASAPYSLVWSGSVDGPRTVSARATDTSGLQSGLATSSFTLDNTAPTLDVSGPNGQTFGPGSTQTWTLNAEDATSGVASVQCSVVPAGQSASLGPCSGGSGEHSVTNRPEGAYAFTVRATDQAGNTHDVTRTFTIDATAPETSVTSGPADGSTLTSRSASFGLAASEAGSTFGCRFFPAGSTPPAFAPCPGAYSATALADGSYTFQATATDAVGNVDATPVTRGFTVDATAPHTTVTKAPKKKVRTKKRKARVSFAFTSDDPAATFQCSLDGAAFAACGSAVTFKVKLGKHTLAVRAVDALGNVEATATTTAWKVVKKKKRR